MVASGGAVSVVDVAVARAAHIFGQPGDGLDMHAVDRPLGHGRCW
jgi:hypothetical protein